MVVEPTVIAGPGAFVPVSVAEDALCRRCQRSFASPASPWASCANATFGACYTSERCAVGPDGASTPS